MSECDSNSDSSDCCAPMVGLDANMRQDRHRSDVRDAYAQVARADSAGEANGNASSCCGVSDDVAINVIVSTRLGYSKADLDLVPGGADMGLGCGNPKAIAALRPGEVVVDLGSGGGLDCFLAAYEVGDAGRVIGVDMTPDMLSKARANATKGEFGNVEFRLGEIEHLPIADATADVIISNCVINLSPDKAQVFRDAFRVLKAGGRLAVSDIVATAKLPDDIRNSPELVAGCMGNASPIGDIENMLAAAGFGQICVEPKDESKAFIREWAPGHDVTDYLVSASITAVKPQGATDNSCC